MSITKNPITRYTVALASANRADKIGALITEAPYFETEEAAEQWRRAYTPKSASTVAIVVKAALYKAN